MIAPPSHHGTRPSFPFRNPLPPVASSTITLSLPPHPLTPSTPTFHHFLYSHYLSSSTLLHPQPLSPSTFSPFFPPFHHFHSIHPLPHPHQPLSPVPSSVSFSPSQNPSPLLCLLYLLRFLPTPPSSPQERPGATSTATTPPENQPPLRSVSRLGQADSRLRKLLWSSSRNEPSLDVCSGNRSVSWIIKWVEEVDTERHRCALREFGLSQRRRSNVAVAPPVFDNRRFWLTLVSFEIGRAHV